MTLAEYKKWYKKKFINKEDFNKFKEEFKIDLKYMKMSFKLEPYQYPAVYAVSNFNSIIYSDDMGLGKTPVSIASISDSWDKGYNRICVVVLNSLIRQWEESIKKFSSFTVIKVQGNKQQRSRAIQQYLDKGADILLVSYNTLSTEKEAFNLFRFDATYFDECDYFKSPKSEVYKQVLSLACRSKKNVLITGTPFSGKPEDTFALISVASKNKIPVWYQYNKYCEFSDMKVPIYSKEHFSKSREVKVKTISKYKNLDDFKELCDNFIFGRKIEETGAILPEIDLKVKLIPKSKELISFETLALKGVFVQDKEHKYKLNSMQKLSYLHRACHSLSTLYKDKVFNEGKLNKLLEEIEKIPKDEQVAIFCNFKFLLDKLYLILKDKGGCSRVTGDITGSSRGQDIDRYKSGENRFLLLTMAGYAGLDLYQTKHLYLLDVIYNKAKDDQIRRRIVRKTSLYNKVYITYILYENSVEESILDLLSKRERLMSLMVDYEKDSSLILKKLETLQRISINIKK